jgi:hypothetical protein
LAALKADQERGQDDERCARVHDLFERPALGWYRQQRVIDSGGITREAT